MGRQGHVVRERRSCVRLLAHPHMVLLVKRHRCPRVRLIVWKHRCSRMRLLVHRVHHGRRSHRRRSWRVVSGCAGVGQARAGPGVDGREQVAPDAFQDVLVDLERTGHGGRLSQKGNRLVEESLQQMLIHVPMEDRVSESGRKDQQVSPLPANSLEAHLQPKLEKTYA